MKIYSYYQEIVTVRALCAFVNTHWLLCVRVFVCRFAKGLNTLGLLEAMKQHPDLFQKLFLQNKSPLRAADVSALFKIKYSPPGTQARDMESKTTCHWRDWLIDVEGNKPLMIIEKHPALQTHTHTPLKGLIVTLASWSHLPPLCHHISEG